MVPGSSFACALASATTAAIVARTPCRHGVHVPCTVPRLVVVLTRPPIVVVRGVPTMGAIAPFVSPRDEYGPAVVMPRLVPMRRTVTITAIVALPIPRLVPAVLLGLDGRRERKAETEHYQDQRTFHVEPSLVGCSIVSIHLDSACVQIEKRPERVGPFCAVSA
jgi:hypothetical protein